MFKADSMQVKKFVTPVWILSIIVLIRIFLLIYVMIEIARLDKNRYAGPVKTSFIVPWIILLAVVPQIIFYWKYAFKLYRKAYAWLHMGLYAFAFVVLPILTPLFTYFMDWLPTKNPANTMYWFNKVNFYVFWTCYIGGFLMIGLIAKTAIAATPLSTDAESSNDLLNDL